MTTEASIDKYKSYISQESDAHSIDLMVATVKITDGIDFNLVYRKDNHQIIQGYFKGISTDLFRDIDGETKTGRHEYDTVIDAISNGTFVKMLEELPGSLKLSDGVSSANFSK